MRHAQSYVFSMMQFSLTKIIGKYSHKMQLMTLHTSLVRNAPIRNIFNTIVHVLQPNPELG